jgi:CheY-like chemotaxis protein
MTLSAAPEAQRRVLIVDDEPTTLAMVKTMLKRANYEVTAVQNGYEALKTLAQTAFDCVITDAMMPSMTGYDLVKAIRRHPEHGTTPVLMLTRKRNREDVTKAIHAGVTDYVLKPIDEFLLLDKVETSIHRGNGKRHIVDCPIDAPMNDARLEAQIKLVSISEAGITVRLPFQIMADFPFRLQNRLFDAIGIKVPLLVLIKCEQSSDVVDSKAYPFEAKFAFIGVIEEDLKKIRWWIQKQEIRRLK